MKRGSQMTSVYVSVEDDGKEGFTRTRYGACIKRLTMEEK